jgi:hypothetical protein
MSSILPALTRVAHQGVIHIWIGGSVGGAETTKKRRHRLQLLFWFWTEQGAPTQPHAPWSRVYHGSYLTQLVESKKVEKLALYCAQSCLEIEQVYLGSAMVWSQPRLR